MKLDKVDPFSEEVHGLRDTGIRVADGYIYNFVCFNDKSLTPTGGGSGTIIVMHLNLGLAESFPDANCNGLE